MVFLNVHWQPRRTGTVVSNSFAFAVAVIIGLSLLKSVWRLRKTKRKQLIFFKRTTSIFAYSYMIWFLYIVIQAFNMKMKYALPLHVIGIIAWGFTQLSLYSLVLGRLIITFKNTPLESKAWVHNSIIGTMITFFLSLLIANFVITSNKIRLGFITIQILSISIVCCSLTYLFCSKLFKLLIHRHQWSDFYQFSGVSSYSTISAPSLAIGNNNGNNTFMSNFHKDSNSISSRKLNNSNTLNKYITPNHTINTVNIKQKNENNKNKHAAILNINTVNNNNSLTNSLGNSLTGNQLFENSKTDNVNNENNKTSSELSLDLTPKKKIKENKYYQFNDNTATKSLGKAGSALSKPSVSSIYSLTYKKLTTLKKYKLGLSENQMRLVIIVTRYSLLSGIALMSTVILLLDNIVGYSLAIKPGSGTKVYRVNIWLNYWIFIPIDGLSNIICIWLHFNYYWYEKLCKPFHHWCEKLCVYVAQKNVQNQMNKVEEEDIRNINGNDNDSLSEFESDVSGLSGLSNSQNQDSYLKHLKD